MLFTALSLLLAGVRGDAIYNPCSFSDVSSLPFCDLSLGAADRAADLVSRLTLQEKVSQMIDKAAEIPRLHIPHYDWWSESLHGVLAHCTDDGRCPTSYPAPINSGASFNMKLVHQMGQQISTEARRLYVERVHGIDSERFQGLDVWAPNINIFRDPRWGRGQETPGEDPYLTSQYAINFVRGLQEGEDSRYLKLVATIKHFDAYSLENWNGMDRFHFDANVSDAGEAFSLLHRCLKLMFVRPGANLSSGFQSCCDGGQCEECHV
jgi:beta-D-xylosidase 4